jgi:hypothetical protein
MVLRQEFCSMEEDLICYDILPASRTEADMQRAMFMQGSQARLMASLDG